MVGSGLAIFFGCWFICLQGGPDLRTGVASPSTLGETTCKTVATYSSDWTADPWSSTAWTASSGGIGCTPHLEPIGANWSGTTPSDNNGLAMQEMPDPAFGLQRALLQVWSSLEQDMAESEVEARQVSQQTETCAGPRGPGGGGHGHFPHEDSLDCHNSQFQSQRGHTVAYQPSSGGFTGRHRGRSVTTRTDTPKSSSDGSLQTFGTSTWTTISDGHPSGRAYTEASRTGRKSRQRGDQIEPWPAQQDGKDPKADHQCHGEDHEVGSRLASFCHTGRRKVSQAPYPLSTDPCRIDCRTEEQVGRTCHDQGRDLQSFSVPSQGLDRAGAGCLGSIGRSRTTRISSAGQCGAGGNGRVSRHGRGRGDDDGGQAGGTSLSKTSLCWLSHKGGQGTSKVEGECQRSQTGQDWMKDNSGDVIPHAMAIPVDCVIDDVFEGSWSWSVAGLQPLYSEADTDSQSSGDPDSELTVSQSRTGLSTPLRCIPFCVDEVISIPGDNSSPILRGRDEALWGFVASQAMENDATRAQDSRVRKSVRFHPHVEIFEFESEIEVSAPEVSLPVTLWGEEEQASSTPLCDSLDFVIPDPGFSGLCACPSLDTKQVAPLELHSEGEADPIDLVIDDPDNFDPLLDDEDNDYVMMPNFAILYDLVSPVEVSQERPLRVITYGLRGQSLGRRDTWVTTRELSDLKRAVWQLWEDQVPQFASCFAYAVTPQPLRELGVTHAWILVVEINPGEDSPPGTCATLALTYSMTVGMMGNPHPRLVPEAITPQQLMPLHHYSQFCIPEGMRICHIELEGALCMPHEDVVVRPGALNKLLLGDLPLAMAGTHHWHPDAEQVAVEVIALAAGGREIFTVVIHASDTPAREFEVDRSAFTNPTILRRLLPPDLRRCRLHWLAPAMLHASLGLATGRFHFIAGSLTPSPTRPLLIVICTFLDDGQEHWQHAVHWLRYGTSITELRRFLFPDANTAFLEHVLLVCNQEPLLTLDDRGPGAVIVHHDVPRIDAEGVSLMQRAALLGRVASPEESSDAPGAYLILQSQRRPRRLYDQISDVMRRRTHFLLEQRSLLHTLVSWTRPRASLWAEDRYTTDVLIAYPRPLDMVDIIVERVDYDTQMAVQAPMVFRVIHSLTHWAFCYSVQQHLHFSPADQRGEPLINGHAWFSASSLARQFQDGDVATFFVKASRPSEECSTSTFSTDEEMSEDEGTDMNHELMTILQIGDLGEDQRFDMLVPHLEIPPVTLQRCTNNALVGWAILCRTFRRPEWQHVRQTLAIAWTDLIPMGEVPVLLVESTGLSSNRDWHVEYLPINVKREDLTLWTLREGSFALVDEFRYTHPTDPSRLRLEPGSQLLLRFFEPALDLETSESGTSFLQLHVETRQNTMFPHHASW